MCACKSVAVFVKPLVNVGYAARRDVLINACVANVAVNERGFVLRIQHVDFGRRRRLKSVRCGVSYVFCELCVRFDFFAVFVNPFRKNEARRDFVLVFVRLRQNDSVADFSACGLDDVALDYEIDGVGGFFKCGIRIDCKVARYV